MSKKIGNYKFCVLDSKIIGPSKDVTLEVTDMEAKVKAGIMFWGSNRKCTALW